MTSKRARYGTGHVFKKGNVWWVKYHRDGEAFYESSRSTTKADANRLLKARLGAIHSGTFVAPNRNFTLEDGTALIVADYKAQGYRSLDRVQRSMKPVRAYFGTKRKLASLQATDLDAYVVHRMDTDSMARATVRNELAALKRVYTLAMDRGIVPARPAFPKFGDPNANARKEFIDATDYAAILAVIATEELLKVKRPYTPDYKATALRTITFVYRSGWRWRSEVRRLTWRNVDLDRERVTLDTSKNKKGRLLNYAADPDLKAVIEAARAYTDTVEQETGTPVPWVFHVEGRPLRADSDPGGFYHFWKTVCLKAGVTGTDGQHKILHDNRRSTVRRLEQSGVSREVAKRVVGHRTDSMYSRYNITMDEDVRDALGRAAAYDRQDTER
jgi:integrase